MGLSPEAYTPGRMTYDLRRLRLHGIIAKEAGTHRYQVTHEGMRICLFMSKVYQRVIRPGCSQLMNGCPKAQGRVITAAMNQLDNAVDQMVTEAKIAA
jgi:hypothetical protein